jgi:hypothetical protein
MMGARSTVVPLFVGCAALAAGGCDERVHLGVIGDGGASLLWRGTFETGNLSEWTSDGKGGTRVENAPSGAVVTQMMGRGGSHAGSVTIAPRMGMDSLNYLYRREPVPQEAYYSAWFYIPSALTVGSWLSLHHFRGSANGDPANLSMIWDVNLYTLPGGQLAAQLGDFVNTFNDQQPFPIPVPRDTWVQFEVLFRKAADLTGRVVVWQDGVQILERAGVVTARSPLVVWEIGVGSDDILPLPATIYVDDAAISLTRLGNLGN